jgi:peptidoglycan/xylan/chitin deacetylase (PgdA/CDA1 family)
MIDNPTFWPNGARLALSISLMYEGGGQPISGAPGVIPEPIRNGLPDMPTNGVFQYGIYEGTPRLLSLFGKHDIKVTAFMIGQAVDNDPALAREVVRFFTYAKSKPGVWFARKGEIADWAMKTRRQTPYLDRGPVTKTGLSGPAE